MKYETPELTALTAINAIQSSVSSKGTGAIGDANNPAVLNEGFVAYADWE